MRPTPTLFALFAGAVLLAGCSSTPGPASQQPLLPPPPAASPYVSGAPDTTSSVPGSAGAMYTFRFKQTDPSSDRFTFRDRQLSFYFRPSPTSLYFRAENLQGKPVWIDWEKSRFIDVNGRAGKLAHGTSRWRDRFSQQAQSQLPGLSQFGDYLFPMDYLIDPGGGRDEQPHLPIVPEDQSAPTYSGRTFGVDLAMVVEDRPTVYSFRFQIVSVIPR